MKKSLTFILRSIGLAILLFTSSINLSMATKHIITVQNFTFSPTSLSVNLGDTIRWTWVSGTHTTTSTTIPVGAVAWDKPIDATHLSYEYVPALTGTYNYMCTIHPSMLAAFTVVCPTAIPVTIDAGGATTFCKGSQVNLFKSSVGSFSSYQWKLDDVAITGATNTNYNAKASGSYALTAFNSCGNASVSNQIIVDVNKKPKAKITPSGPITICTNESVLLTVSSSNNQTYIWKKDNQKIAGATNSTLLVTAAGSYTCKVTKTNTGCKKTSKPVVVSVTCKGSFVSDRVGASVFPNPTQDYFTLNFSGLSNEEMTINIYDLSGKLVETHERSFENMVVGKNLPAGIYFAEIKSAGNPAITIKLLKN